MWHGFSRIPVEGCECLMHIAVRWIESSVTVDLGLGQRNLHKWPHQRQVVRCSGELLRRNVAFGYIPKG